MVNITYQFLNSFAFIVLAAAGLAVIFGMMGIINLAHGEFIMLGAYTTVTASKAGIPLVLAIMTGALATGVFGLVLERLVIRHFYKRVLDSIVATFAISVIIVQSMLIVVGPTEQGIGTPLGSLNLGGYSFSTYRVILATSALGILVFLYLLFMFTRYGIYARATIQNPSMAAALGVNTRLLYTLTFGLGSALAGLAGGLYAPTLSLTPNMGSSFIIEAFVAIIVGGTNILIGLPPAAAILALVQSLLTAWGGQLYGQIGLLLAVILVARILPRGISSWLSTPSN